MGDVDSDEDIVELEQHQQAAGTSTKSNNKSGTMFSKELRCMMYGYGDDICPYQESVAVVEELTIQYVTQLISKALDIGKPGRVQIEDIAFLLRKDRQKYARVRELLTMNEELKKARRAINDLDTMATNS